MSRSSCRVCRAVLFDKLDTAKMHGLDTSNVSSRVETWRAKWNLGYIRRYATIQRVDVFTYAPIAYTDFTRIAVSNTASDSLTN